MNLVLATLLLCLLTTLIFAKDDDSFELDDFEDFLEDLIENNEVEMKDDFNGFDDLDNKDDFDSDEKNDFDRRRRSFRARFA